MTNNNNNNNMTELEKQIRLECELKYQNKKLTEELEAYKPKVFEYNKPITINVMEDKWDNAIASEVARQDIDRISYKTRQDREIAYNRKKEELLKDIKDNRKYNK